MAHTNMIDKIIEMIPGKSAVGIRGLTMSEDVFGCHFPNFPILPGVLMIQSLNELAVKLIAESKEIEQRDSAIVLKKAEHLKFYKYARPGDVLKVSVRVIRQEEEQMILSGSIYCDDRKIFELKKLVYEI